MGLHSGLSILSFRNLGAKRENSSKDEMIDALLGGTGPGALEKDKLLSNSASRR
jgi:hypothetical protein